MSWNNVDDKHKKKYDRNFVSCEESFEKKYIIDTIMEEFPYFVRANVERAVEHCCRTIRAPRGRKEFLKCVSENIGKV
jgi:hypothetical protein